MDTYVLLAIIISIAVFLAVVTSANQIVFNKFNRINKFRSEINVKAQDFLSYASDEEGLTRLKFGRIHGKLSDCYIPKRRMIAMSDSCYNNASVAAIAIVAHELGHAIQHEKRNFMYVLSRITGRIFRLLASLIIPAAVTGLILLIFPELAYIGEILLYSAGGVLVAGLLFRILTIGVEYDASRRAMNILKKYKVLNEKELKYARTLMSSAGFTYVASFFSTILGINLIKRKMRQ